VDGGTMQPAEKNGAAPAPLPAMASDTQWCKIDFPPLALRLLEAKQSG
jgi:hypothetical protein